MPINVNERIQKVLVRSDFDNFPGKGKLLKLEDNPLISEKFKP
jgi:hypothetical protein